MHHIKALFVLKSHIVCSKLMNSSTICMFCFLNEIGLNNKYEVGFIITRSNGCRNNLEI